MEKFISHPALSLQTISFCARDVGFQNYSYFFHQFKMGYKVSSREFIINRAIGQPQQDIPWEKQKRGCKNTASLILRSSAYDVHGYYAKSDQDSQYDSDLCKNSVPSAVFILAKITICIAAAGHGAQALGLTLLNGYTNDDCYCHNQNSRTENI